ncbi:MAG: DoxX family protein [Rhodoglobus sp.]
MTIAVWIASALLALANLGAGGFKLLRPKPKLVEVQPWTNDFGAAQIKGIGALEVLAAVGLILPPLTGIAPILAAFAAVGVVILQAGAIATHVRRHESIVPNIVLVLLAAFVAVGRFLGF